ncbi:MAG: TolC family protein [Planctomycetes bacterium]|nr:TolC family protein [Planctomycetota bacterium]
MRLPARTPGYAVRLLAGFVPLSALLFATVSGKQPPAPTTPTVGPATPGARGHVAKTQNPLPAPNPIPGEKYDDADLGPELSLGDCIAIALERQPSLKAVKHSTEATERGYKALTNFGTASTLLAPDLEVRKQQAKRGLMATSAEYQKLHNEVVQDVTRLFFTAIYALQQQQVAENVVARLDQLVELAKIILKTEKDPAKLEGFNYLKLRMMENGLIEAKKLYLTAKVGRQKALAGLREVMSVDARTFPFRIKDTALPLMAQNKPVTKDFVVGLALERRPELVLAAAGVDAFRLEVYAQGRIPFKRAVPTLASGADIKAKEIPAPIRTATEYRPGAIIPEMPTQLVGSKYDRVCRAMAFAQRAEAVYEKARNLVIAEAEGTYFDFDLASERLTLAKQQFELSKDIQKRASDAEPTTKQKDQLLQSEVIAAKAQSDYLQAVHEYLLALAALERVTAGGIAPEFPGR